MADIAKVMKFELRYISGGGEFYDMQKALWNLQRQTREILNKTIQIFCNWNWAEESLNKPKDKTELNRYIYHALADEYSDFNTGNINATIRAAKKKYDALRGDIEKGVVSIPSYRRDQPLRIHNKNIVLISDEDKWKVKVALFSLPYKSEHQLKKDERPTFELVVGDKTQECICERIYSGQYKIGESQLSYEKKKWMLYLTYKFEKPEQSGDPDRILGVDLGVVNAVCASVYGEKDRLCIPGDEALEKIRRLEAMKRSKQKQARYCGEGRIGHGTKTRVSSVYKTGERISNMQKTLNHRWSKAVVEYAEKCGCGQIQIEELSGIKGDNSFPKRLEHWTYFDLQTKIIYKAKEKGIKVKKVKPQYTSQRCAQCGCIDKKNRVVQDKFCCIECGYKENADFNASQNLAIADIDKIIKKQLKKNSAKVK